MLNLRTAPTNALYFNFFMWSKMLMLKLHVEEAERPNADMTVSVATTRTCRAEGTHSAETTKTRTTESCSTILALHRLPQQLAFRTPQRRLQDDPKSQNTGVPVMMHRTVNDPSRRTGPDPGRANRSPRTIHHEA